MDNKVIRVIKLDKLEPVRISDGICPFTGEHCLLHNCHYFVQYTEPKEGVVYCHCDHEASFDDLDCIYFPASYNSINHELLDTCRFTPDIKLGSLACKECFNFCGIVESSDPFLRELGTDFLVRCLK